MGLMPLLPQMSPCSPCWEAGGLSNPSNAGVAQRAARTLSPSVSLGFLMREPDATDLEAVATECRAALAEGWQRWELREIAASVLRSRGCRTDDAHRIAIAAVRHLGASLRA